MKEAENTNIDLDKITRSKVKKELFSKLAEEVGPNELREINYNVYESGSLEGGLVNITGFMELE